MADETTLAVARVYAESLLDLAERAGEAERVGEEIAGLAQATERDPHFATFTVSPTIDLEERSASLERMFRGRLADLLVNALEVMNRKGRLALLPQVARLYEQLYNVRHGRVEVVVTSAVALGDEQRQRLVAALARYTGRTPILVERVDPELLGGLVVRIGDRKIDDSVRRDIEELREALEQRAAAEVLRGRLSDAVLGISPASAASA